MLFFNLNIKQINFNCLWIFISVLKFRHHLFQNQVPLRHHWNAIKYEVLITSILTFDHISSIFFCTFSSETIHKTHEHVEPHTPNCSRAHSDLASLPFNVNNIPSKVIYKNFGRFLMHSLCSIGRYLSLTSNLSANGMLSVLVWIWIVWIWSPLLLVENSSENSRCCAAWFGPIGACIFLIRSSFPPVFLPLTKMNVTSGLHGLTRSIV